MKRKLKDYKEIALIFIAAIVGFAYAVVKIIELFILA